MDSNLFFGHHIDALSLGGRAAALLLSMFLSGIIGLERQMRGQPAGLRTHILVGIGSTLITITSVEYSVVSLGGHGDAGRLAAQIVSGIGFLGAGAILREGRSVHGLTTAASIWAVAGIGIAVGSSPRLGEVAVIATCIVLATLVALTWLEDVFRLKHQSCDIRAEILEADNGPSKLLGELAEKGFVVGRVSSDPGKSPSSEPTRKMHIRVKLPSGYDSTRCLTLFAGKPYVVSFEVE